ncbi:flagellar motor protein MotB [Pelagibaculum spongiae]|uniref:Type VI secretion system protein TssL n=1 Tax=Pelagibaculum spongiae TaxID=2080658 RepID=A0A2V1GZB4_9GAMM|nr:flagellar motor protein MotB [Pelagibaculum spongiae]PVZ71503.1 type VI secretion system protein TssL [Pelagibaculum spongiae]
MEEELPPPKKDAGGGGWLATFADLMSLLMCFFILLLSFSEMDVLKYKQLAGSMRNAFGVQSEIEVKQIPKGTSIIAQEFSPGRPDPTAINTVRQFTVNTNEQTLEFKQEDNTDESSGGEKTDQQAVEKIKKLIEDAIEKAAKEKAQELKQKLDFQIKKGQIQVSISGRQIIIRIKEKGSFRSGAYELNKNFLPVLRTIRSVLISTEGEITVAGHTDDLPIEAFRIRSNWDLSTARAVSVAHQLMKDNLIDKKRIAVQGFADTRPLVANDNGENRAINRRVEIVIVQGKAKQTDSVSAEEQARKIITDSQGNQSILIK